MSFAKTFGQRHVLRFLSSHIDLSGCRITAASPAGLRVTDGVTQALPEKHRRLHSA
mgnify:CR=1 FL=1